MAREVGARQRIRFQLVPAAAGVLGLAVVALLLWFNDGGDLQIGVAVALLVAVFVDGLLAYVAVSRGDIRVDPPPLVTAGEPSNWVVGVAGTRRPVSLRLHLVGPAQDVLATDARAGVVALPPLVRGQIPFLVFDMTSRGPLGLVVAGRRVVVGFTVPVPVAPPAVEVDTTWPKVRASAYGLHERTPVGDDMFRTVRPYRRGDAPRRIHWKATAHHGELMVKELDGLGVIRVRIVAALGPPGPQAEWVTAVVRGIATQAFEKGWAVDLVTRDAGEVAPVLSSMGQAFRRPPVVVVPPVTDISTVDAPVKDIVQVAQRLARAAYGVPTSRGRRSDLLCYVSPEGVRWS